MSKDWQTWYYFGQETVQARFWLHRAAPSVSQIDYVNQFWLALFNSDFCCTLIAYNDMAIQYVCSFESPKPEEFGTIKPQKSYITMSLYAIKRRTDRHTDRKTDRLFSLVINTKVFQNVNRMSKRQSDRKEDIQSAGQTEWQNDSMADSRAAKEPALVFIFF